MESEKIRILQADSKKEKKDEIDKIRLGKSTTQPEKQNSSLVDNNINIDNFC